MKIVLFGMGEVYEKNKDKISKDDVIIAFLDNNEQLQGTEYEGIPIYEPKEVRNLPYENIVIISTYFIQMRDQLIQLGCEREHILYYEEYISRQKSGQLSVFYGKNSGQDKKKYLIITNPLGYHGGAIVAAYAALELQNKGYEAVIASPEGNKRFVDEFHKQGITFVVYPNLQYATWDELFWIKDFDRIIVNTYPMILCAIEISKHREVVVWLHENDIAYPGMNFWKDIIVQNIFNANLSMYAVSSVARENFFHNVAKAQIGLLPYGIPDRNRKIQKKDEKLTFAIIGTIQPIKRQMLFLEAVRLLNQSCSHCEFLIIGGERETEVDYVQKVIKEAENFENVHIMGERTRDALEEIYPQIDVVVVPSSQEAMSLVTTEAMMYGKVCILSDIAGMADYVEDGKNGFIFRSDDVNSLVKHMAYCIENREKLRVLGGNARKTYSQYFSMKAFGDRLEQI